MSDPSFRDRVLDVIADIPAGSVLSYGAVAALAGSPRAARGVGSVLSAHGDGVPWWRVVSADGSIAAGRPHNAARVQRSLLETEGVEFCGGRLDLDRYGWIPVPWRDRAPT